MSAERVWELIARKLSGGASDEELEELDQLLRIHPDLHFPIQTITDLWQSGQEADDKGELEAAYDKHIDRMQQQGIAINQHLPHNNKEAYLIEGAHPKSRRRYFWYAAAAIAILAIGILIFRAPKGSS